MVDRFPKQLFRHRPDEGLYGDCHRTVIACILGLQPEDVPHFAADNADTAAFHRVKERFLAERGLYEFTVCYHGCDLDQILETVGGQNRRAYYILGGFSRTGVNHSVLCRGRDIVHDPSLDDAGIVGPMDDGFYRVSFLVVLPTEDGRA